MSTRDQNDEIEDAAVLEIRGRLLALGWTVEETLKDYGKDLVIEIFENRKATGTHVLGQAKGHKRVEKLADGTVTQRLTLKRLRYLVRLTQPSILFVVDVTTREVWWLPMQLDQKARTSATSDSDDSSSTTLHIPGSQTLDAGDAAEFRQAVSQSLVRISIDVLSAGAADCFAAAVRRGSDAEKVTSRLEDLADVARVQYAQELIGRGNLEAACKELRSIWADSSKASPTRVIAYSMFDDIETGNLHQLGVPHRQLWKAAVIRAEALVKSAEEGDLVIRLFARLRQIAAQLHATAEKFFMETFHKLPREGPGLPSVSLDIAVRWRDSAELINKSIARFLRILPLALRYARAVVPGVIGGFLNSLAPVWGATKFSPDSSASARLLELADNLVDLSVSIAKEAKDWDTIERIAFMSASSFPDEENTEATALRRAEAAIKAIPDRLRRQDAREAIAGSLPKQSEGLMPNGGLELSELEDFYKEIAIAAGIDPNDDKSPLSTELRQALEDLSPERILRTCKHLSVVMRLVSPLGKQLLMPSCGLKELVCTKHGYLHDGVSLDQTLKQFQTSHCNACGDVSPREDTFQWNRSWQEQEEDRLRDLGFLPKGRPGPSTAR